MVCNSKDIAEKILRANPEVTKEFLDLLYAYVSTRYDEEHSYKEYVGCLSSDDNFKKIAWQFPYDSPKSKE